MHKFKSLSLALLLIAGPVYGEQTRFMQTQIGTQLTQEMQFFGMAEEDVARYHEIMQTTPAGSWYERLDPVEVLGIMAKTDEQRAKYAKLTAKAAHERVDRELKFMHAYNDAYKELYPGARVLDRTSNKTSFFIGSSDALVYFTALIDDAAKGNIKKLQNFQDKHGATLHIYFLDGAGQSKQIAFLKKSGVGSGQIKSGQVVLAQTPPPDDVWMQESPVGAMGIMRQNGSLDWINLGK